MSYNSGAIVLLISNQLHAACLADFEITRPITPRIVLHSVLLPLFISNTFSVQHQVSVVNNQYINANFWVKISSSIWTLINENEKINSIKRKQTLL